MIKKNKHQASRTENTDNNIVKLPWIPILGPKQKNFKMQDERYLYISCKTKEYTM